MSPYDIGYYFGWLLLPAVGLALLLTGLRRKRETKAARDDAIAQSASYWQVEAPAQVPAVQGSVRVGFGIGLLVLTLLGAVGHVAGVVQDRVDDSKVQIVLPLTLLSMERHDSYFLDQVNQARAQVPNEIQDASVAWYGSPFGGVVVVVGRGRTDSPAREVDAALDGADVKAKVLSRTSVAPATPHGAAGCAKIQPPQKGSFERYLCVYVDKRSFVVVSDGEATTIDQAAARGRSIQHEVVLMSSAQVAMRTPSRVSTVKITLPAKLLGARKDATVAAKERTAFLAQMSGFTHQADLAAYEEPSGNLFLVDALAGDMTSRPSFLRQYRSSIAADTGKDPGRPISVPAGAGGGSGFCWKIVIETLPTVVCVIVDNESYVGIYELQSNDVAAVAAKTRQVRAVVRKAS